MNDPRLGLGIAGVLLLAISTRKKRTTGSFDKLIDYHQIIDSVQNGKKLSEKELKDFQFAQTLVMEQYQDAFYSSLDVWRNSEPEFFHVLTEIIRIHTIWFNKKYSPVPSIFSTNLEDRAKNNALIEKHFCTAPNETVPTVKLPSPIHENWVFLEEWQQSFLTVIKAL